MKLTLYGAALGARAIVPKGCIIHRITLDGKGNANIGFRCGDEGGDKMFPQPGGGMGTFRSVRLRGVRTVSHRGINVSGPARIGFTLSPAHAVCGRDGVEIRCTMKGDTSSKSLRGGKGRKRRR